MTCRRNFLPESVVKQRGLNHGPPTRQVSSPRRQVLEWVRSLARESSSTKDPITCPQIRTWMAAAAASGHVLKLQFPRPHPDLLIQNFWEGNPGVRVLQIHPEESH